MARGQQKIQSQAKAAEKQSKIKKQQGHSATDQKKAAQKALVHVCVVCKAQMPDPKTYKQHFENKHPKNDLPDDLKDNPNLPFILRHCFKDVKKEADHESNISAVCKICSKTLLLRADFHATTNFLNHIKRKGHDNLLKEYEQLKSQHTKKRKCSVADSDNISTASISKKLKQSILSNSLQKSVNLDKLIVNFVVDTMSPMSIVENKSFSALIEGAQQLTRPPKLMCRRTCNNKIADAYTEYKGNLKNKLKAAQYVCTTADIWSSSRRSYLGMTVHWIDSDTFARNSSALACRRFKGTHSFDKIAELIIEIHEEYDLTLSKITKTVTDNGSNMVKAFKIFGKLDLETDTCSGPLMNVDLENLEVNLNENPYNNNQQDDDDNDYILALNEFPEPQENDLYQLPNHERCATHTLHLIPARDFDKDRHKNNSYRKLHDAAMAKCQVVWNLCSRSPKASEIYLEVTDNPRSKDSILAAISYLFFKLKWVPKNKKEHLRELFIQEVRKFKNQNLKSCLLSQTSERKREKSESYYMFQDSDSSATSEGGSANNTTIDLETLQYLKDESTNLEMLNGYPTDKDTVIDTDRRFGSDIQKGTRVWEVGVDVTRFKNTVIGTESLRRAVPTDSVLFEK
ncbi:unnamed protein product [Chilo suppressalis]|uniref:Small EDRK-rich factor-like N-terminal domain-containing protein n=1 Tax=Chilo suppressalis TaxID=168631 RepID=A0ABN8B7W7_CHISP|nr:unnamed protein product [Chilo suppressalis]